MVTALFPDKITAQVQYGEIIRSWCVYYQYQHFIDLIRRIYQHKAKLAKGFTQKYTLYG